MRRELRRNLATNPQANAAWTVAWGTGGAGTSELVDGLRVATWTTSATGVTVITRS